MLLIPGDVLGRFNKFEDGVLKNYGGRVFLDFDYMASKFSEELERRSKGKVYVQTEKGKVPLWDFLMETCGQDEERLKRYRQAMEKHITEERALRIIQKFIKENPIDEELYSDEDIRFLLGEAYGFKESTTGYYYARVLDFYEWSKKLSDIEEYLEKEGYEIGNREKDRIAGIFLGEVHKLLVESLKSHLEQKGFYSAGVISFDYPDFYIELTGEEFFSYDISEKRAAREILEHMKERGELYWVLDFETYFNKNRKTLRDVCEVAVYSPFLRELRRWINNESTKVLDLIDVDWIVVSSGLTRKKTGTRSNRR